MFIAKENKTIYNAQLCNEVCTWLEKWNMAAVLTECVRTNFKFKKTYLKWLQ